MRGLLTRLDQAFFRAGHLRDLAIMRIVLAGSYLVLLRPDLQDQLWLAREGSAAHFVPPPALKVLLLPFGAWGIRPDPMLVHGFWLLSMVAAVLLLVGLWTRPSALTLAFTYTALVAHRYSFGEFHHTEAPYAIALWILVFSHSGAVWSLDRVLFRLRARRESARPGVDLLARRPGPSPEATWPLEATRWILALCYLSAGLSKVLRGGASWLNGHTLAYYLIQDSMSPEMPLALALADARPLTVALSAVTLLFELTFPIAVVFAPAALLYVPVGLALHAGIWFLIGAPFPQWMVLYVVFLPSLREGWRRVSVKATAVKATAGRGGAGAPDEPGGDGPVRGPGAAPATHR